MLVSGLNFGGLELDSQDMFLRPLADHAVLGGLMWGASVPEQGDSTAFAGQALSHAVEV